VRSLLDQLFDYSPSAKGMIEDLENPLITLSRPLKIIYNKDNAFATGESLGLASYTISFDHEFKTDLGGGGIINTAGFWVPVPLERILAHEMAHAILGVRDPWGPGRPANTALGPAAAKLDLRGGAVAAS
jgi:hypothetical protein